MSTEDTRRVVAGYVAALQRGDTSALRDGFTPQRRGRSAATSRSPARGPSRRDLDGFLAKMTATLDPGTPGTQTLHRIIADGDYAVTEWTSHARTRNGMPYDNDYAVVFRVAGGRIDAVTEYCDTSYMKRTLFDQ